MKWLTYSSVLFLLSGLACEMKMSFLYSFKPVHGQFIVFTFKVVYLLYFYNTLKKK